MTFSFSGLSIYSSDIVVPLQAIGFNARLTIDENVFLNLILSYIGMALGSIALIVAIISSILG